MITAIISHIFKHSILFIYFLALLYVVGCGQKSELGTTPGGIPKVVLTHPGNEAVNFSKDSLDNPSAVWAIFSKDMNSTSVRANTFLLTACGREVPHSANSPAYSPQTRTVTILPTKLEPNQQYVALVTRSATDLEGNPLEQTVIWRFTTGARIDNFPPVFDGLQGVTPNSSTELTLEWSAAVDSIDQATSQDQLDYLIYQGTGALCESNQINFSIPFKTLKSADVCKNLDQNSSTLECSYRVTGLTASTRYCFVVRALDLGCHQEANRKVVAETTRVGGKLYVANLGANNLLVFDNAGEAEQVNPRVITSDQSQLKAPIGLALGEKVINATTQTKKKSLYVANFLSNSVLAYDWQEGSQEKCPASSLPIGSLFPSGDVLPCRVLGGVLSALSQPIGLFADSNNDRLYITNYNTNSIVVFDNASQVDASTIKVPPKRIVIASSPPDVIPYDNPIGIAVDTRDKGILYVAYQTTNNIAIIDKISDVLNRGEVNVAPTRLISGLGQATNYTRISNPRGLWLDPDKDRLYVVNQGSATTNTDDAILVFDKASTIAGNVSPDWIIKGADSRQPLLNAPYMPFLVSYNNATKHRLFVANSRDGKVLVFDDIDASLDFGRCSLDNQNVPICSPIPSLVLEGAMTHLSIPRGVVAEHQVDGSDTLYVTNESPIITNRLSTYSINVFENVAITLPRLEKKPEKMIAPSINGPTGVTVDTSRETLYLSSILGDSISVFENINNMNTVSPARRIFGPKTLLTAPAGIALAGDRLYVANLFASDVLEFDLGQCSASGDCDISPVSKSSYSEPNVNLVSPLGIAVDPGNPDDPNDDLFYVSYRDQTFGDNKGDSIVVFKRNISSGGFDPFRRIKSSSPGLVGPAGLYLDLATDRLYVANRSADTILVFDISDQAFQYVCDSTTTVQVCILTPIQVISQVSAVDPSFQLSEPNWVFLDSFSNPNKLYVTNRAVTNHGDSRMLVYNEADTANGAVLPARSIGGLLIPVGLFLDPTK